MTKTIKAVNNFKENFIMVVVESKQTKAQFVAVKHNLKGLTVFNDNNCTVYTENEFDECFKVVAYFDEPKVTF